MSLSIRFGPFVLDYATRQLTRDAREIHLAPKAFTLLAALVDARPKVVSKTELQEHLWPATFVAEANLSNLVAEIREALGDRTRAPLFIRTVHGVGYAFCGESTVLAAARGPGGLRPLCWLEWGQRRFPLSAGEHIVGRDPDVDVRLDVSTVSRRHARLVVAPDRIVLEDLDSKNGTLRGAERVTLPTVLADGDVIRFGTLVLTVHTRGLMSTDTLVSPTPPPPPPPSPRDVRGRP